MRGPNGEKRTGGTVQRAMQVMRIATGEEQETGVKPKIPKITRKVTRELAL